MTDRARSPEDKNVGRGPTREDKRTESTVDNTRKIDVHRTEPTAPDVRKKVQHA